MEDFESAWDVLCERDRSAYKSSFNYTMQTVRLPGQTPHPLVVVDGEAQWDEARQGWFVPTRGHMRPKMRAKYFVVREGAVYRACSRPPGGSSK